MIVSILVTLIDSEGYEEMMSENVVSKIKISNEFWFGFFKALLHYSFYLMQFLTNCLHTALSPFVLLFR
jgi:hypothetical protein